MVRRQSSDAFFRIGVPMFILVTGGSLLLSQLLQGKFDIKVYPSITISDHTALTQLESLVLSSCRLCRKLSRELETWACSQGSHAKALKRNFR